jgi:hypothetical protein
MANKVFHIRVKVTSNNTFYMKGVCISESKKKAVEYVASEVNNWLRASRKDDNNKIDIIECKELRTDFIMSTNGKNDSN